MTKKNNPSPKTTAKKAQPPIPAAPQPLASAPTGQAPPPPVTQAQPVATPTPPMLAHVANDNNTGTKLELQSSYAALMAGLSANYAPDAMFPLVQGNFTRDELVAQFQQYAQAAQATSTAYQAWRSAVQNERAIEASISPLREGVRNIVVAKLGKSSPQLTGYGFSPRKVAQTKALTKAASQVKAEATRKARGTVGKKQRLTISGNVTGVTITPITSAPSTEPAAPATTATPVTAAAPKS